MPNWCNNSIAIQGPTDTIKQLWEDAHQEEGGFGLLNAMVPMPKELEGTTSPGDTPNWYDWRVTNWGTKWDIDDTGLEFTDHGDGTAEISGWFDSAWAPPIDAYNAFLDMMDNCYITASYHEGGMDFGGFYDNGSVEECNDCYAQSKLPHDEQDDVFKRLDDEYDLSSSYEMWDDDEEDVDLTDLSPNTV